MFCSHDQNFTEWQTGGEEVKFMSKSVFITKVKPMHTGNSLAIRHFSRLYLPIHMVNIQSKDVE